jgi:hypothetical protein
MERSSYQRRYLVRHPSGHEEFRTSSFCMPKHQPPCVAVAIGKDVVAVRDTKDRDSATLQYTHEEWDAFIKGVKAGEFDLHK